MGKKQKKISKPSLSGLLKENKMLRDKVDFLERLFNEAPAIVYISDNIRKCIHWCGTSLEKATGYTFAEIQAMGPRFYKAVMHPDDFYLSDFRRKFFFDNNEMFGGVVRTKHKDSKDGWRWWVGHAVVFKRTPEGLPELLLCAFVDFNHALNTESTISEALNHILRLQHGYLLEMLSDREKQVLQLIVKGYNNKEIAARLFLSPYTVETHRKNIRLKLKVKNTSELVVLAKKIGFH